MKWDETQDIWSKSAYITNERLRTLFSVKMVSGGGGGVNHINLLVTLRCQMAKEKIGGGGDKIFYHFCVFKMKQFPTH